MKLGKEMIEDLSKELEQLSGKKSDLENMMDTFGEERDISFPVFRRFYPKLVAQDFVNVQPMTQPAGNIFFMDFKYDEKKLENL